MAYVVSLAILWLSLVGTARADGLDTAPLRARLSALEANKPKGLPDGVLVSIAHVLDVYERIHDSFPQDATEWFTRAARYLDAAEQGRDGFLAEKGRIVSRGYRSPISQRVQGYTVYVPPNYAPDKSWPLMVVLHGGSSNGNLFLGVVLGNNMSWKEYDVHLWHRYEPVWSPDWIVVAPDGYGQVLWRWMGEQDVLDVIDDVQRHYNVDPDRVALGGLSNGGVGAYSIGSRHASRFSVVQAIAGAPSWRFYAGESSVVEPEATLMRSVSAMDLVENWFNTDFRYYHGTVDPGPMRPAYVHRLDEAVKQRGIPHKGKWYEAGHDLLYLVHRHGKVYGELADARRKRRPREVHVVTGDYRAARQHWLEVTRFERYPELATLKAKVDGERVEVSTSNVTAFVVDLREVPLSTDAVQFVIDGQTLPREQRAALGHRVHWVRADRWRLGLPREQGVAKRPGLSGPVSDAYYGRMVHVYGSQKPETADALKKLATKGARGWPLWLWTVDQTVIADREVTPELMREAHLVLYGAPGDNSVLDRLMPKLPIRVEGDAVVAGGKRYTGTGVGTRFIYPNPEAQERYVIVHAAPTLDGVRRAHNLPDFVPDYTIFDASTTGARARLVPTKAPLSRGFFDAHWQLAP